MSERLTIPRIVWTLWLQGLDRAPDVVSRCIESWRRWNPTWDIVVLDQRTLHDVAELPRLDPRTHVTRAALSDIARINLLADRGGIWADATCLCSMPLDEWLPRYATGGFFAFRSPGRDRYIASWFLATAPRSAIAAAYRDAVNEYWTTNLFRRNTASRAFVKAVAPILATNRNLPHLWFSRPIRTKARVYPYYWFHYLFGEVLRERPDIRAAWDAVPVLTADGPHLVQRVGMFKPPTHELRQAVEERAYPMYKLHWKFEDRALRAGTSLDYVLSEFG